MRRLLALLLTAALLTPACERPADRAVEDYAATARALSDLTPFPGATLLSAVSGVEAAEARYGSLAPPDSVAAYYRRMLAERGYVVERETDDAGVHTIYSRKGDQPIWVRISPNTGRPGVTWSVVGILAPAADSLRP